MTLEQNQKVKAEIDAVRKKGFRPVVVGCFINSAKVLMVYNQKFDLWQLPQGGIEAGETPETACRRETKEELGKSFIADCEPEMTFLGTDKLIFPGKTQGSRDLVTEEGQNIRMKGKAYYFYALRKKTLNVNISETEFDAFKWLDYKNAYQLIKTINQPGKLRITLRALDLLKENKFVK